jgi:predicted metal-dependent phosphoesterase TrpH
LIRADLHIHTAYSSDASNQPKTIVEKLNAHPIIKVLAITDHNTCEGYLKVKELAKAYTDILIIPGVEITAQEGEIIVLGITELPPKPWTAQNIIDFARENEALTVAPHPYRGFGLADHIQKLEINAIETLNGITKPSLNRKAEKIAKKRGLPGVAGSDAHDDKDPWNVRTEIQARLDVDDILKAVKKGIVRVSSIDKSIHF